MQLTDARDYQIIFLALFLGLGIGTRDWTLNPVFIVVTIITCIFTQVFCVLVVNRNFFHQQEEEHQFSLPLSWGIRSALITSLGLNLLLRADSLLTIILASVSAIASKFLFRFANKHFFNPANFGIITALICSRDGWVSPGQWGEDWWYGLLFIGCGGMLLQRIGRWDTSAVFMAVYAGLEAFRNLWLGWTWDVYFHKLANGSLLLFALFMVTDPRSIPNTTEGRIIWAAIVALITFYFRNYLYITTAPFWALFILAPLIPLIDKLLPGNRFTWQSGS